MASKCFYLNLFYIVFYILYCFTVETLSQSASVASKSKITSHNIQLISVLERKERQAELPPDKKNDTNEKAKVTKKPTALDIKTSMTYTDVNDKQKPKIGVKKDPVTTQMSPTDSHVVEHSVNSGKGKAELDHLRSESNHTFNTEVVSSNSTSNVATELPIKGAPSLDNNNMTALDSDIDANKFLQSDFNKTLRENKIMTQREDHHLYYNSSTLYDPEAFQRYWVDFDKFKEAKDILSNSHRRAVTVKLSYNFPFYGHLIDKIIIATGGFLYTGEYVHSWLSVTQYIAPLMANFDTASSNHSSIKYLDNGTAFTVQWENVVLQDKPDEGNFTFQCTLFKNGNIVFAYKHISEVIDNTTNSQHPIKVGLSDAYIIDRTIFLVRRKTIYEYHRVKFGRDSIRNGTVILLNALETCLGLKDCRSCLTEIPKFECNWCSNRCSNGMDRNRQDWLAKGCINKKRLTVDECSAEDASFSITQSHASPVHSSKNSSSMDIGIAGIMGILFVIGLILGTGGWFFYAYRNPHTPAGQFLIRYRPGQWSWRRGEARYTAATIHM